MLKSIFLFIVCLLITGCSSIPSVQKGQSLSEYLNSIDFSGSVLVVCEGRIIHSKGYGFSNLERKTANDENTQYLIGSMTKQFTALAIMQLQEKGLLNIDDYVSKYLPDFPNGSKITIRNLLTHSSGIYNFTDEWNNIKYANLSSGDVVEIFRNKPLKFTPGSKVRYSNSGYVLAGKIIEVVTDLSYSDYVRVNIFQPLGMESSAYGLNYGLENNAATGYKNGKPLDLINLTDTYAAGALSSSVDDLYLWATSFESRPLVNESSLSEIFPTNRNGLGVGFGTGRFKVVMGLGWSFYETEYGAEYSHDGHIEGFSSTIARYPDKNSFIIILSNQDQYDAWTLKDRIARLIFSGN